MFDLICFYFFEFCFMWQVGQIIIQNGARIFQKRKKKEDKQIETKYI